MTSIITAHNLGVTFLEPVFANLNLTISKGNKISLVAANGSGKSTFLNCLAGVTEPTTGTITRQKGLHIGYVEQNLPHDEARGKTFYDWVLSALNVDQAENERWRVDVILDDLHIPTNIHQKYLSDLSGGWQRTAMLAAVWVAEPNVLLLDEPTNHLDLQRIGLLQAWLARLPQNIAVVVTSHDRAFLDAITNKTVFLRPDSTRVFALPFTKARLALDEADASDERRFANDMNKVKQLKKQAAKLKNIGINSGSDLLLIKTKQLSERASKIENATKPLNLGSSAGDIRLVNKGTHAKALVLIPELYVPIPGGPVLYKSDKKWISKGDRIVLLGSNGSGKTRLLELLNQAYKDADSTIKWTPSVKLVYSDQHLSLLSNSDTPMGTIKNEIAIEDQVARSALAGAGILVRMQDKKIGNLSEGQKARLIMLVLRLKNPNFYILDEPTNHLDIEGQEALEDELISLDVSCLIASHDRSFMRNVGNRFWWIKNKKLIEVSSPETFFESVMNKDLP